MRGPRHLVIVVVLAVAAGGIAFAATRSGEGARAGTAAPVVDWTLAPGAAPTAHHVAPRTAPLAALSAGADRSLAALDGDWGVAVIDPASGPATKRTRSSTSRSPP
ncbi:MAG: hypothetical protein U0547_00460 [Dehalococcoidia bacterium]